ncbi:ENTH domain-containing protein C19F8.03c [Ceratocystis lukuohia]|uniref:ENTH domain-containing protein C19F8.03c n=2 Tax=Ceratocystis TaxID=5157 RepID=A0A2C5X0P4_9PEZI|nr:ENTH domain-containing protein C19F8.03c [Ceratocystis fimbriata CBS 114723]
MASSFEKAVKGATKIKAAPPKTKYIEHIIRATYSGEAGVGEVFRALTFRLRETTWTVVIKSLITIHFMIREGQADMALAYLSRHRNILITSPYNNGHSHGRTISQYAQYISERARSFRETKVDWVRCKEPRLEKLPVDKGLLRETESVQAQLTALLECQVMDDEHDEINITIFRLLILDLLALFQAVNLGMINILGNFFEMSKPDAERALAIYRLFVEQTDLVVGYLGVARQYEHFTRVEVPKLKHAPVHLGRQLEEYLKDPDFEIHRRQYIAEQANKKNKANKSGTNSAPSRSPETSTIPDFNRPKTSAGPATVKSAAQQAPALPTQNLIDLFDTIEQNQTVQTIAQPSVSGPQVQISTGFQTQPNGFVQNGMMFQPTGATTNQFQAQNFAAPANIPMTTGAGFGGFTSQPQTQLPQMPQAYQTTGMQVLQTGPPAFGQQLQQQQAMQLQQPNVQMQQQPQPLVPMATGTNPFRQSMMPPPPSSPKSTNPFARNQLNSQAMSGVSLNATGASAGGFGGALSQQTPMVTGTNPFAKPAGLLAPQQTAAQTGLMPQATGSTNPFRQSMMPQSTGWHQPQATIGGGLDQLGTIPVFPRQGQ